MSGFAHAAGVAGLALSLYTFAGTTFPSLRAEHRRRQGFRRKYDGYAPPWLMCWTYWIGAEGLFFGGKFSSTS